MKNLQSSITKILTDHRPNDNAYPVKAILKWHEEESLKRLESFTERVKSIAPSSVNQYLDRALEELEAKRKGET